MQYYVLGANGAKFGPAELHLLNEWIAQNRITPDTYVEDAVSGVKTPARAVAGLNFPPPVVPVSGHMGPSSLGGNSSGGIQLGGPSLTTQHPAFPPQSGSNTGVGTPLGSTPNAALFDPLAPQPAQSSGPPDPRALSAQYGAAPIPQTPQSPYGQAYPSNYVRQMPNLGGGSDSLFLPGHDKNLVWQALICAFGGPLLSYVIRYGLFIPIYGVRAGSQVYAHNRGLGILLIVLNVIGFVVGIGVRFLWMAHF